MRSRSPARLLDRDAELEAIAEAVERAGAGAGTTVVVEGVAGIGKTSLLDHARRRGSEAGMTVLAARAAEFEASYAWGVVRQLLERTVRGEGDERARRLLGGAARLAAPVIGIAPEPDDGPSDDYAVAHGLYWLAANLAEEAPLLLAVDDIHWADTASLRAIVHLARRLEGLPILVVLTVRAPRSAGAAGDALIAGLMAEPGITVLRPAALGASACEALVEDELAEDAASGFKAACQELTGGNPFLMHALLESLAADGVGGGEADVEHVRRLTPEAVSRKVLLQLGRMPAGTRAVARAVAVLGTGATTARACRLAELDDEAGVAAVEALMAEHLVQGDRELAFVHPLVRAAVYEDLAPPVRERWHERAARVLADTGAPLEELTVQLLASG
ncbi:MAG: transcriptional regulator, LuxR family, partial [Solirubrobacterales bacterium]|nr:transcriptional regulator, LuxR family [Solirubrobacterales bacterium]